MYGRLTAASAANGLRQRRLKNLANVSLGKIPQNGFRGASLAKVRSVPARYYSPSAAASVHDLNCIPAFNDVVSVILRPATFNPAPQLTGTNRVASILSNVPQSNCEMLTSRQAVSLSACTSVASISDRRPMFLGSDSEFR
jgi:hypothetical protein